MQVLSCQRAVSLIAVRRPMQASTRVSPVTKATVCHRQRGFTLIELLVTLTIAVVLIMYAVPGFKSITMSNRLTTTANDIVGSIHTARLEAIKLNAPTQVCSDLATNNTTDPLGTACTTQTGAVYALTGTTATQLRAGTIGISTPLQLNGNMTALRFSTAGLGQRAGTTTPYTGLVADICTSAISGGNHRVIWMTTGSILTTTTTPGACP